MNSTRIILEVFSGLYLGTFAGLACWFFIRTPTVLLPEFEPVGLDVSHYPPYPCPLPFPWNLRRYLDHHFYTPHEYDAAVRAMLIVRPWEVDRGGNSHQRRLARRRLARACKLGNA